MVRRWSWVVGALLAALLVSGCSSSDDSPPEQSAAPTPITELDAGSLRLARVEFCDRLPDAAVRDALDGDPETDDAWGNGDPVPGGADGGDVGHEIGCGWTGADGAIARAWVFARPVTAVLADSLVREAREREGCTAAPAPVLGDPALLQTCTLADGSQRVRRAGLFGDTWLTCELTGAPERLRARTDAWCAAVVAALDTTGG